MRAEEKSSLYVPPNHGEEPLSCGSARILLCELAVGRPADQRADGRDGALVVRVEAEARVVIAESALHVVAGLFAQNPGDREIASFARTRWMTSFSVICAVPSTPMRCGTVERFCRGE